MFLARLVLVLLVHLLQLQSNWVTCSECNNGDYTFDPFDCNAFFQCEFGTWIRRNCPRELHFNRMIIACDFPWNANCFEEGCM